jgi:hypothetical protein
MQKLIVALILGFSISAASAESGVDAGHYTDMGKFATALGARTGVWYEKRDPLYIAAPPSGVLGARLLVFEAQTD